MSNLAYTLGRLFIPIVFLVSGARKFMNIKSTTDALAAKALPIPDQIAVWTGMPKYEALAYLAAGIEVVCGLLLILGFGTRVAALVLCVYVVGTIYVSHDFWNMDGAQATANLTQALKNLAIMGGLLLLFAGGGGPHSLDGRRRAI
jgi:putative oxidoreductase